MKKLFRPAALLVYVLALLSFFLIGCMYAGWIEAGKNQGLAGGAIVMGYGVMFAAVALVAALLVAYRVSTFWLKRISIVLALFLVGSVAYLQWKARERAKERQQTGCLNAPPQTDFTIAL